MERKLQASDLADGLARRSNMPHREAEMFVRLFFEVVESGLMRENIVKVKGLGSFKLVDVDARESVNIHNGERIEIAGHTKVSFTPDPVLRDAVNKPFAEFETVVINKGTDLHLMETMNLSEETQPVEEPSPTDVETIEPEQEEVVEVVEDTPAIEPEQRVMDEVVSVEETVHAEPSPVPIPEVEEPAKEKEAPAMEPVPVPAPEEEPASSAAEPNLIPEEETSTEDATPQPNAPTVVQKAAVVEEADVVRHANHVHDASQTHPHAHGPWHILGACLLSILIFAAGYVAGTFYPLTLPSKETKTETPAKPAPEKKATPTAQPKAKAPQQPAPAPAAPKKRQPSEVLAYPQVEGGEYLIVGIKANDVMSQGKTLLNLSIKYYGSKDFVPYICTMNGISNPDIVPLNMELKIPELRHR